MFKKINKLLTPAERTRAKLVFLLMLLSAFLEMFGVASIMPFVAVLSTPEILDSNQLLKSFYSYFNFENRQDFLMFLGFSVFFIFVMSVFLKGLTTYAVLRYSNMRSHSFSYRLLKGYLMQPYSFFLGRNTAELSRTLFSEVNEVINGSLIPCLRVVSGGLIAISITILLLMVEPWLTVIVAVTLGSAFTLVYIFTKKILSRMGKRRLNTNQQRFVLANEALNGIKELKLLGREKSYLERFERVSIQNAKDQTVSKAIGDIPHLAIQAIAFGGILLLILYLMKSYGGFQQALPVIALYAFAGYRLLPAFQDVFKNATQLRFYKSALDHLYNDLLLLENYEKNKKINCEKISGDISLESIVFNYPDTEKSTLNRISLKIKKGSSVAFVGTTGAGKSTLVDIILGLLTPQSGKVRVGETDININNAHAWQANIGYVPQSIYLADATIAENIAFGIPVENIDMHAVERAAQMAKVHEFIYEHLSDKYKTVVGERGVRLSGGQRQRIGIARALYHNPEVIVFDEATSALDNATEAAVMEAIELLKQEKTVILIAHRLSTVQRCNNIFVLKAGSLVGEGKFAELLSTSEDFSYLANANQ